MSTRHTIVVAPLAVVGVTFAAVAVLHCWQTTSELEPAPRAAVISSPASAMRPDGSARASDRDSGLVAELRSRLSEADDADAVADSLRTLLPDDAERALQLAARVARTTDKRYQLVSRLLAVWAPADPPAAWRWAVRQTDAWSEGGQPTLTEIVLTRLALDSPSSIRVVLSAGEWAGPPFVDQGLAALLQAHRTEEARAVLDQWARETAAGAAVTAPFERVAFALAQDSPPRAAEWLQTLPPSPGGEAACAVVADAWAAVDAPAAMAWAQSLPDGEGRELALEHAFGRWAAREGELALRWLAAREAEPDADRLIAHWVISSEQTRHHPDIARPWIALIREPALRARVVAVMQ